MTIFSSIILGIIEGLTEFFPVSSTGHLIIAEKLLGIHEPSLFFNVTIQLGAIIAACFYFRKRILRILVEAATHLSFKTTAFYYLLATLPALIIGAIFHSFISSLQTNIVVVATTTILVAVFFFWIERTYALNAKKENGKKPTAIDYLTMGLFQAISVIPGVSRSGITISGALTRGFSFKEATDTTFIMAIPIMSAATGFEVFSLLKNGLSLQGDVLLHTSIGFIVAFLVALLTIAITVPLLKKYGFMPFIIYRLILGAGIILLLL